MSNTQIHSPEPLHDSQPPLQIPLSDEFIIPLSDQQVQTVITSPEKIIPGFKSQYDKASESPSLSGSMESCIEKRPARVHGAIEVGRDRNGDERVDLVEAMVISPGIITRGLARIRGRNPQSYLMGTRKKDWYTKEKEPLFKH